MEIFDKKWIEERLPERHGAKAELARAMGIDMDKLSKILGGTRRVQPREIPGLLAFFGTSAEQEVAALAHKSFAEPTVAPLAPESSATLDATMRILLPDRSGDVTLYTAKDDAPGLAILRGDILAVELGGTARDGDTVICNLSDPEIDATETVLLRLLTPWLTDGIAGHAPIRVDSEDNSIGIAGAVRAVLRR